MPLAKLTPAERAEAAKRESKGVEFKESFDPTTDGDWCELIKDFAAMANSGGGIVVIGVRNNGSPSRFNPQPVLELDPATITDKLFKYTGEDHSGFDIVPAKRQGRRVAVVVIESLNSLIIFTKPGTYADPTSPKRQRTAFAQGTIYFRHGAKSEPARRKDVDDFIEARIRSERKAWLRNVRKLADAPADSRVAFVRATSTGDDGEPTRIQLTIDPSAPVYGRLEADVTHPYRQTELVKELQRALKARTEVNSHDVVSVRKAYGIDEASRPEFVHKPRFSSRQYSEAFVEWLVRQFDGDSKFFEKARDRHYELTHPQ